MLYVFAIFLTLVGYSTGAVLSTRSRSRVADPRLADSVLIVLFGVAAIYFLREAIAFKHWALPWLLFMAISGFTAERAFRTLSPSHGEFASPPSPTAPQSIWQRWRSFAAQSADFQARILIVLLYFIFLWPFAFFARRNDPLRTNAANTTSSWVSRPASSEDIAAARRQF